MIIEAKLRHFAAALIVATGISGQVRSARAETQLAAPDAALSLSKLVATVLAQNPTVQATVCDSRSAAFAVQGEVARYPFVLGLDSSWTHTANPTLAPGAQASSGIVTNGTQEALNAGVEMKKHLVWGTDLSLRFSAARQSATQFFSLGSLGPMAPMFPGANVDGTIENRLGPGYGAALKLAAVQPLLRGSGRAVTEANLHASRVNLTTAELIRERTASEVLRDALTAYWETWYATAAVDIQRHARETARKQSGDATARIETGSLASVEGLTFETQLASRTEDVVNAEDEQYRRSAELARLLGMAERSDLIVVPLDAPPESSSTAGNLQDEALSASPDLRVLASQITLASVQAQTAGDNLRPRLDVDAYVQAQGLGYDDVPAAVRQFSQLGAVSGHVGLTFELPLNDARERSERTRALLAIETARHKWNEGRQQVLASLTSAIQAERSARSRAELAAHTSEIAGRRLEAEQQRYATGSSTAIQVLQAEDDLRGAALRTARAKVDTVVAHIDVSHLAGRLTREVGVEVDVGPDCSSSRVTATGAVSNRHE
jgi:outer membrane protein